MENQKKRAKEWCKEQTKCEQEWQSRQKKRRVNTSDNKNAAIIKHLKAGCESMSHMLFPSGRKNESTNSVQEATKRGIRIHITSCSRSKKSSTDTQMTRRTRKKKRSIVCTASSAISEQSRLPKRLEHDFFENEQKRRRKWNRTASHFRISVSNHRVDRFFSKRRSNIAKEHKTRSASSQSIPMSMYGGTLADTRRKWLRDCVSRDGQPSCGNEGMVRRSRVADLLIRLLLSSWDISVSFSFTHAMKCRSGKGMGGMRRSYADFVLLSSFCFIGQKAFPRRWCCQAEARVTMYDTRSSDLCVQTVLLYR